jgi:hypothetical protein
MPLIILRGTKKSAQLKDVAKGYSRILKINSLKILFLEALL